MRRHGLESGRYGNEGISNGGEARLKAGSQSDQDDEMIRQADEISALLAEIDAQDAEDTKEIKPIDDGPTTWDNLAQRAEPFHSKAESAPTSPTRNNNEEEIAKLKQNLWKIFNS